MRLKHFLWRSLQNSLPVNESIYRRIGKGNSMCNCYGEVAETTEHIFFIYTKAKMIWKIALVRWEGITELQSNLWR